MLSEQSLSISKLLPLAMSQPYFSYFSSIEHEDSWMDQYFNQQVLTYRFSQEEYQVSKILANQNIFSDLPVDNEEKNGQNITERRKNKSIFHNFQKHLLTLLKKVISIKKSELVQLPLGNRAYDLWKIFLSLRSSSKRNLYIIFGITQRENQSNIRKTAESLPQLNRLLTKYGLKQIQEAQEILRKIVCQQTSTLEKIQLMVECKMKKFQQFYAYFLGFMEELSQGVISRRMTKSRKMKLAKANDGKE